MSPVEYYYPKVLPEHRVLGEVPQILPKGLTIDQHLLVLEFSSLFARVAFGHAADLKSRRGNRVAQEDLDRLRGARKKIELDGSISSLVPIISELIVNRARQTIELK